MSNFQEDKIFSEEPTNFDIPAETSKTLESDITASDKVSDEGDCAYLFDVAHVSSTDWTYRFAFESLPRSIPLDVHVLGTCAWCMGRANVDTQVQSESSPRHSRKLQADEW